MNQVSIPTTRNGATVNTDEKKDDVESRPTPREETHAAAPAQEVPPDSIADVELGTSSTNQDHGMLLTREQIASRRRPVTQKILVLLDNTRGYDSYIWQRG